jgi:hypothetical protein
MPICWQGSAQHSTAVLGSGDVLCGQLLFFLTALVCSMHATSDVQPSLSSVGDAVLIALDVC